MTIKDVLKIVATYLGRERVINALDGLENGESNSDVNTIINDLTRCTNIVLSELAMTYVPMEKTETVKTKEGRLYFSDLTETAVKIIKILDCNGKEVSGELNYEYIDNIKGEVNVTYNYLPTNYGLTEEIGYSQSKMPSRIIALGVTAEYCLILRAFEESVMWHKRYMDALSDMLAPKNAKIKKRVWV